MFSRLHFSTCQSEMEVLGWGGVGGEDDDGEGCENLVCVNLFM